MKNLIGFIFFTNLFVITILPQLTNHSISTQEQITDSVKLAPCEMKDRLEVVKKLFVSFGAKEEEIKIEQFKDISNVVISKKGKSEETIIIGAHYDKVKEGCGAIDNWTGISVLAHLYKTLSKFETEKSFIFVAFDKEEGGLFGSKAMAKAIPKENRKKYCSMVNMDSFGLGIPQVLTNTSNSKLTRYAKSLAKETNFPYSQAEILNANADSRSFLDNGIPAITFTGLGINWEKNLHTNQDKLENINMESVFLGYRFILNFVIKLELEGCQNFR